MKNKLFYSYLILLFSFIVTILYHHFAYIGHYGYDDMTYASLANNLNHHVTDFNDHYSYRWPTIFLTAFFYKIFGVCDMASSLPAILVTFLILTIVFQILKNENLLVLSIGLAFTLLNQWSIFNSDKLMPDIYVVLFVSFSFYVIYRYKYIRKKNPLFHAIFFALGMLLGFMSKEIVLLIIPVLLYLFLTDLFLKRDVKFWMYSIASGLVALVLYFLLIWLLTGSPFKRFEAIFGNSYLNMCSYDKQPLIFLLKRVFYEFFLMMIQQGMLTGIVFAIAYIAGKNIKKTMQFHDSVSFFAVSAFLLLLSSNFMSISFTAYVPMCLDVRHYLFIIPIAAIPASHVLFSFFEKKYYAVQICILLVFLTVVSYFFAGNSFRDLYVPLLILLVISLFLPARFKLSFLFTVIFIFILMVLPYRMVQYAENVKYQRQKDIVHDFFIANNRNCYVLTDDVQRRLGAYYGGFNPDCKCTFLMMNDCDIYTLDPNKKKYLLLNGYTRSLSKLEDSDLPYYAKNIDASNKLLFSDKDMNFYIWELIEFKQNKSSNILHTFNGFEKSERYWLQKSENIKNDIQHTGMSSSSFNEYSATFQYPMDSLNMDSASKVIISINTWCLSRAATTAKLVVSIELGEKAYIWQSIEVNKFIKAFGNWSNVKFEIPVNSNEIQKNSILKVYIWNTEKKELFVDDFDILIKRLQ